MEPDWITLLKENCDEYAINITRNRDSDKIRISRGEREVTKCHYITISVEKDLGNFLIARYSNTRMLTDLSQFPNEVSTCVDMLKLAIERHRGSK